MQSQSLKLGAMRLGLILLLCCSMIDCIFGVYGILRAVFDHMINDWLITCSVCDIVDGLFSSFGYIMILDQYDVNPKSKRTGTWLQIVHVSKLISGPWTSYLIGIPNQLPETLHFLLKAHFIKLIVFVIVSMSVILCLLRIKCKIDKLCNEDNYLYMSPQSQSKTQIK